jgi:ketosteroid isomerase-like protein
MERRPEPPAPVAGPTAGRGMRVARSLGCVLLRVVAPALGLLLAIGCRGAAGDEDARTAVREADVAFSRASEQRDLQAFLELVSDSASFFPGGGRVLRGKAEVREQWKRFFEPDGPTLLWEPTAAAASRSGDLGYTMGRWRFRAEGPDGPRVGTGKYVTIWRKEGDGRWRAVVDIGDTDEEQAPAAPPTSQSSSPPDSQ